MQLLVSILLIFLFFSNPNLLNSSVYHIVVIQRAANSCLFYHCLRRSYTVCYSICTSVFVPQTLCPAFQ